MGKPDTQSRRDIMAEKDLLLFGVGVGVGIGAAVAVIMIHRWWGNR
jgi:hypothetical protein